MANVSIHHHVPVERGSDERQVKEVTGAGGFTEALAGLAAVVLSIIGLAGIFSQELAAIGIIAVAAALLIEGGSIAARLYRSNARMGESDVDSAEVRGGLGAESLTAVAGIALGILALLRVDPAVLLPVSAIVLGVGLLFGSAAADRVNSPRFAGPVPPDTTGSVVRESVRMASGAHVLVGLAAIVLGIIGIASAASFVTFTLISVLCLGGALLLSGAAIGGRLVEALRT